MSDIDIDPITVAGIIADFVSAIADDGKIDAEEAADLLNSLSALVPAESLLAKAGALIEDALYRDVGELLAAAERKREKAGEARAEGKDAKADRLEARAVELEAKAADA